MIIYHNPTDLSAYLGRQVATGRQVGFVPTMGALHEGHITLVRQCLAAADLTVASIFVNPTQFNDARDFQKYPVTIDADIQQLVAAGCDVLFLPDVASIYPDGTAGLRRYDLGYLEEILEGKYRPGHFQGVCQVVDRLLEVVNPQQLFMGRKDYQQCMVIKKLLELTGRNTSLIVCDTIRENDGLAMSSRNTRLDPEQRTLAATIFRVLSGMRDSLAPGSLRSLTTDGIQSLEAAGFRVDYLEICRADNLEPQANWDGHTPLVALVAAFLGDVRLIDNLPLAD
jgi:pantoate--beta-alanine ligase